VRRPLADAQSRAGGQFQGSLTRPGRKPARPGTVARAEQHQMVSTSAKLAVKGHLLRAAIRSRTAMPERTRSAAAWLELLILAQGMRCSFCCWLQPWVALPQRGATRQSRGGHKRRRGRTFEQLGQSRILAMLLLTLRGTPFFFAGDEIGMTNPSAVRAGRVRAPSAGRALAHALGRQPEWRLHLWLPMGGDVGERNVARLERDPRSILPPLPRACGKRAHGRPELQPRPASPISRILDAPVVPSHL
jgi:hypothetical protein